MDGTWTWQFVHNLARTSPKLPTAQMVGFLLLVVGAVGVACTLAVFALLLLFPFWAGAELMFYLFLRARRREMQRVLDPPQDMPLEVGIWHIDRIEAAADTLKAIYPQIVEDFLTGWFPGHRFGDLRLEDVSPWISDTFLFKPYRRLTASDKKKVMAYAEYIEGVYSRASGAAFAFAPGATGAKYIAPGFNVTGPFATVHYPLFVYIFVVSMHAGGGLILRQLGFNHYSQNSHQQLGLDYWYGARGAMRRRAQD